MKKVGVMIRDNMRAACLAVVFSMPAAMAQTNSSVAGRVQATTGQPLAAVQVTARQAETGLTRKTQSNADGHYVLASLPAGVYDIRAEANSFRPLTHSGIRLSVAETLGLDFELELGTLEQAVTVSGRQPLVNTKTSELSYLVEEQSIRQLPLNGRNYTDLALLQPGVVAFQNRDGGSVVAHGLGMSINGQDPRSNVYLLDGTPLNDFTNGPAGSAASTALGMETIREFRVETNAYSAEFGRNSGGQINALTKSGTNETRGSLYYFHRNDQMDARNFFDPAQRPEFKRNQFGGAFGGPIVRDRAFFFAGYEALRERLGRTINAVVPDANAHQGLIPDPANPGRLLNVGVHPAVRPYLSEYPLPNGPSRGQGLALFTHTFHQTLRQDFGQFRYDQNLKEGGQLFVRYTADDASQRLPMDFPQFPRSFLSRNQFFTAEHAYVFSPRALNIFRAGFSRTRIGQDVEANTAAPLGAFVPGRGLVGNIDIGGASRFGPQTSVNVQLTQNVFSLEDNLSYIAGRHTLKFGGLAERYRDNMVNPTFALGIHTFADLRAFLENRPLRFLGLAPTGALDRYWRFTLMGFYVQDSIVVRPRLTLHVGLRYEFSTMPVDTQGRDSALPNLLDPAPTVGPLYRNPTKKNISPRFGFAWDPFGGGRTSVRGGYGWFFNTNNHQNLIVTVTNPPATPRLIIGAGTTFPVPPFERGIGNSIRPIEFNLKNPNVHVWNLSVQRQIPHDVVVTVGYAGSRGIHLLRSADLNTAIPQRQPDGTLFFPAGAPRQNPNFSTIELKKSDGNSWYNAAIFEVRKRFASGFQLQSSYTFSRNIDTTQASTFFSDATNGTTSAMPEYPGFSYNKGLADYHAKHNWVLNFTWELPLAGSATGMTKQWLEGWQLSGISNVRSGNPLTLFVQANRSRSLWSPSLGPGLGPDRPSISPGFTHQSAVLGSPDRYFNPDAFFLQPAGTLGNLGRGALIGPNLRSFDLSLLKNIRWSRLGDSGRIQFRVEAFNLFNRANFGPPSLLAFAGSRDGEAPFSSLGLVRNTTTSSRQIQLGLRLSF
ncbi:MAG: TonB-dependent receptor [Acidimicrobiia bacterium]|nr:TonB-dependent receptor [Acidimicrobiia bacterium]